EAYLTAGDYKQAMKHLKIGMAREYYSVAYRRYRNEMLRKGASVFLSCMVILVIALLVARRFRKKKRRR
ncbi:MAG: gluconolactonase, partial [Lachnospiraceae bacterium]|nr:gluconolactonase [Lachnospiraceae bacterium]